MARQRRRRRGASTGPETHASQPKAQAVQPPERGEVWESGVYQPKSVIMNKLNVDMLCEISDHLGACDAVALALSCKGTYKHLFFRARERLKTGGREQKVAAQCMLEKDVAGGQWYYCPRNRKFVLYQSPIRAENSHGRLDCDKQANQKSARGNKSKTARTKAHSESVVARGLRKKPWRALPWDPYSIFLPQGFGPKAFGTIISKGFVTFSPKGPRYGLKYDVAHLVMNRHFYGGSVGLPLSLLERTIQTRCERYPAWNSTWEPRIIDNELYLRATHILKGNRKTERALPKLDLELCSHVKVALDADDDYGSDEYHFRKLEQSRKLIWDTWVTTLHDSVHKHAMTTIDEDGSLAVCSRLRACNYCLQASFTEIERLHDNWTATVTVHYRLGSCRSMDWVWQLATKKREFGLSHDDLDRDTIGSSREQWHADEAQHGIKKWLQAQRRHFPSAPRYFTTDTICGFLAQHLGPNALGY